MNKSLLKRIIPGVIIAAAAVAVVLLRSGAIASGAAAADKMAYSVSLIALLAGIVGLIAGFLPKKRETDIRTLTLAAMFAALCYIGFAYLRIDIPVGTEKTAFHLGNVFCVLAALFIGPLWGGMAGAVGLTIADLTSAYVTSAPKTFLMKLCIGIVTGLVARALTKSDSARKAPGNAAAIIAAIAGMAFNTVADPIVGFFYKTYVLGVPQDAAQIWIKMSAVTTAVNAVIAVIVASALYMALMPALKRSRLLPGN